MLFEQIDKKDILRIVRRNVSKAKKEILATMLLAEELSNPLPASYFSLLKERVSEGVFLKRLGFGTKEEYNKARNRISINEKNYIFRLTAKKINYQRFIIIDREKIFFGKGNVFFSSEHKPLIKVFSDYFFYYFRRGKI